MKLKKAYFHIPSGMRWLASQLNFCVQLILINCSTKPLYTVIRCNHFFNNKCHVKMCSTRQVQSQSHRKSYVKNFLNFITVEPILVFLNIPLCLLSIAVQNLVLEKVEIIAIIYMFREQLILIF